MITDWAREEKERGISLVVGINLLRIVGFLGDVIGNPLSIGYVIQV